MLVIMKTINKYINERLHVTSKSFYTCHPKTKDELKEIIIQRIESDGPDCDLNDIDVSNITDMSHLFDASTDSLGNKIFRDFNGDISQWDVSNVKNMEDMFGYCKQFNGDLSRWDVSKVENMRGMFQFCKQFNSDISHWDVSNVKNMQYMFHVCEKFNQNLSRWNVSNVERMDYIFSHCENFNYDLSGWDVSKVGHHLSGAFGHCPAKPKWYNKNVFEY